MYFQLFMKNINVKSKDAGWMLQVLQCELKMVHITCVHKNH